MNAIGTSPGTPSAGTANGSSSGASTGLQSGAGATKGFAGLLVQVIGGAQKGTDGAVAQGLPTSLQGLIGLVNQSANETGTTDLMALLNGLTEQLNKLDAGAELPAELQEQLAALLLMLQSLLQLPGMNNQQQSGTNGLSGNGAVDQDTLVKQQQAPHSMQSIIQALQDSVQRMTDRISQGGTLPVQVSVFAEPLRQAIDALRQATAKQQTAMDSLKGSGKEGNQAADTNAGNFPEIKAASSQGQVSAGVKAQSVIHHSSLPMRNPIWAFQAVTVSDEGQMTGSQSAISTLESTESGSQNQPAPVWTMLKGDTSFLTAITQSGTASSAQVPVQQFADQMGKFLIKQFVLSQGNGASEAKISLHPEHLGQVDIKIMIQNGLLTAKFITDNGAARELLETQMSQLRTALQGQGLQVEKMEVVQQSAASAASFFQQQHRQQGSGNQENRTGNRRSGELYGDAAEFELELERTAYLREVGFGSSLNVTA